MRLRYRVVGDYHVDRPEMQGLRGPQSTGTNGPRSFPAQWDSSRDCKPDFLSQVTYRGGYSAGGPPLPIPNREVKPGRADGTAPPGGRVGCRRPSGSPPTRWESRLPPPFGEPVREAGDCLSGGLPFFISVMNFLTSLHVLRYVILRLLRESFAIAAIVIINDKALCVGLEFANLLVLRDKRKDANHINRCQILKPKDSFRR